jgi:tagatose 6-phosphate kinase
MILIVCPNLAVDRTLEIAHFDIGRVHRARRAEIRAGGNGVNAARALAGIGEEAFLLGFVGGTSGQRIVSGLTEEEIASDLVPMSGESRTCTILLEPDGVATVINEVGPTVDAASPLLERFGAALPRAAAVGFMGSLLPGLPERLYAQLIEYCHAAGIPSLVDTSGSALASALEARPSVATPNRSEAEALLSSPLDSLDSIADAVGKLHTLGPGIAAITMGSRGVVASTGDLIAHAFVRDPSDLRMGNPTGAGDALAAGILAGMVRRYSFEDTLRLGVATATASLAEGYGRFRPKDVRVEAVRFECL